MREVTLIPKHAPVEQTLPELNHGMFPQRMPEEKSTPRREKAPKATPTPAEKAAAAARRKSARGTATPATATATPAAGSSASTPAAGTPSEVRKGRPRGRLTRVSMPISTMEDLMNIQLAGGLGDVRREYFPQLLHNMLPSHASQLIYSRDRTRCYARTACPDLRDSCQADPAWRQADQASRGQADPRIACYWPGKPWWKRIKRTQRDKSRSGYVVCRA